MGTPDIVMILARASNGVIGKDGAIPWHIPADLKRFKRLTMGQPIIMGRKTFESFPQPLPGRRHIVLTRDTGWQAEGADVAHDIDSALRIADASKIWIVGGSEIYKLFEPLAAQIELTEVNLRAEGDTVMPAFDEQIWHETAREDHASQDGRPAFSFVTLERKET